MLRYQRQLSFTGFTEHHQQSLQHATVLVVGVGGLAAACLPYLCGAGIGQLILVDGDKVEASNLHRQTLFREEDLGLNKAEVAVRRLSGLNSEIKITSLPFFLDENNVNQLPEEIHLVIDCTDRFHTKYMLNDFCSGKRIPFISASNYQWEGQLIILSNRREEINVRSVFPSPPSASGLACQDIGALGPILGILGSAQALEAIRILSSFEMIQDEMLYFDLRTYRVHRWAIPEVKENRESYVEPSIDLSQTEFDNKRQNGQVLVVDVRGPGEKPEAPFPCIQIPLDELEGWVSQWHPMQEIVFFCHSGIRSAHAVELLQNHSFTNVSHLRGGILRYTST